MFDKMLVIDPQKHFPIADYMFPKADYYAPVLPPDKMPGLQAGLASNEKIHQLYKVKVLSEKDLQSSYDVVLIVWPLNSLGNWLDARTHCLVPTTISNATDMEDRREMFHTIYDLISQVSPKKVIWFDDCDSPIISKGLQWVDSQGYQVDAIFKREYRRTHAYEYDDRIHPFPFLGGSRPDPWFLFEKRKKGNAGVNRCFWSGAPIYRFQTERPDEWCNRKDFLEEIRNFLVIKSGLPQSEFLNQFNYYKFFLHLNGTGHLCGRFFEGLSRDSLMIMQQMDVVFPFDEGDGFHPLCVVKSPREFVESLLRMSSDDALYKECKAAQDHVIDKYYNYEWITNYIVEKCK
tara:strand:+ start:1065 stop:2105 length:1041 start_codon:yes stop_codon:yes gene_type:complete